jgi:hypothetical protein
MQFAKGLARGAAIPAAERSTERELRASIVAMQLNVLLE